jgi:hypothetical protein
MPTQATRSRDDIDFATRQYAVLIAGGLDDNEAKTLLAAVLGEEHVDPSTATATPAPGRAAAEADAMAAIARERGGNAFAARAAMAAAIAEARLFALDWWRPMRSFILYAALLLVLAVALVAFFMSYVLPAFSTLDATMGVAAHGASAWLMSRGGLRMLVPLACAAVLLVLFVLASLAARRAMEDLRPLPGAARMPWLYGASGKSYAVVRRLEQGNALSAAGIPIPNLPDALQKLRAGDPARGLGGRWMAISARLDQAAQLGTLDAELAWQKRQAWSHLQTCCELARDRLILATRVAFYILIGYLIAALYMPIFTIASYVGVTP